MEPVVAQMGPGDHAGQESQALWESLRPRVGDVFRARRVWYTRVHGKTVPQWSKTLKCIDRITKGMRDV